MDPAHVTQYSYVTRNGLAVQATLEMVLIHELMHAIGGLTDDEVRGIFDKPDSADFKANEIYRDIGIPERVSYAGFDVKEMASPGTNYTFGETITGAIYARNVVSVDAFTTATNNVLITGDGLANTFKGGNGRDFIYGDDGDDLVLGRNGNDFLVGDAGKDTFIGGEGNDELRGDGKEGEATTVGELDHADYRDVARPISITIHGTSVSVADGEGGTDTLHAIERITGTAGRDRLTLVGPVAAGTHLTVDAHGGQGSDPRDTIVFDKSASLRLDRDGSGSLSSTGGGSIQLEGFHTQVLASSENDTISDDSAGHKNIDGGDGDDVISVAGASGSANLYGGAGDDILHGGGGNDVLVGGDGVNQLDGGDGADLLIVGGNSYDSGRSDWEEVDTVVGGGGSDTLAAIGDVSPTLKGEAGNDIYDLSEIRHAGYVQVVGGRGSGHDELVGRTIRSLGHLASEHSGAIVDWTDTSMSEVKLVWDTRQVGYSEEYHRSIYVGDLALVSKSGDSMLFRQMLGLVFDTGGVFYVESIWDLPSIFLSDESVYFLDGGGWITIEQGSVAPYDHARADYAAAQAVEQPPAGTQGDDDLRGSAADDVVSGGAGDDQYEASAGSDSFDGGAGTDTLSLFQGVAGFGFERLESGAVRVSARNGLSAVTTISDVEQVYSVADDRSYALAALAGDFGTSGDDPSLSGTAASDHLFGLAGNDMLLGGASADTLNGGAGDDVLNGGADADTMTGGAGDDLYLVDDAADKLIELPAEGFDTARTALASYVLPIHVDKLVFNGADAFSGVGNALDNVISGGAGDDKLYGKGGGDKLDGLDGNDKLAGELGNDRLIGGAGNDTLDGGEDDDKLEGGANNDRLSGAAGNDLLFGGDGNDKLSGDAGADQMTGGSGADQFLYAAPGDAAVGTRLDRILDFARGEGDRIDLSAIDADAALAGDQAFTIVAGSAFTAAGQLRVETANGVHIVSGEVTGDGLADFRFEVVSPTPLASADFLL